ncbi:hypothetical protein B1B_17038, partial [mine drainage metagenome]
NANVPIWQGGLLIPWGAMIPWKLTALVTFTGVAIVAITLYLKHVSRGRLHWGDAGKSQAVALIAVGVSISLIMALMGYIRENSRGPIPDHQPHVDQPAAGLHPALRQRSSPQRPGQRSVDHHAGGPASVKLIFRPIHKASDEFREVTKPPISRTMETYL